MIPALLHGKLSREQENMEDLVKERAGADTSEVIIGDIEVIETEN